MSALTDVPLTETELAEISTQLEKKTAQERVAWTLERFRPDVMASTSFGAQAAVTLHLVTRQWPEIPVVLTDTGYLFPETYKFGDRLVEQLGLNLKVYRAPLSPAWQEARWGKLWEQGVEGLDRYNQMNKVEPMRRALRELGARAWITGMRRQQSRSRTNLPIALFQRETVKVNPIADWTDRQVFLYLKEHGLPYHPLWEQGYVSIGDVHTTRPLSSELSEEQTRFFGLKRECGLHDEAAWDPVL